MARRKYTEEENKARRYNRTKKWYLANKEKAHARTKTYIEKNKEKWTEYQKKYQGKLRQSEIDNRWKELQEIYPVPDEYIEKMKEMFKIIKKKK